MRIELQAKILRIEIEKASKEREAQRIAHEKHLAEVEKNR